LPAKNAAAAAVQRRERVVVLHRVAQLAFVAHHLSAGNATEENARVHFNRRQLVLGQQHEIIIRLFRLQLRAAPLDVQVPLVGRGELARHLRILLPPRQIGIQQRFQSQRAESDIAKLDPAAVVLQANPSRGQTERIGVVADKFVIEGDPKLIAFQMHVHRSPSSVTPRGFWLVGFLAFNDTGSRERIVERCDVHFITINRGVLGSQRRPQEDAAVGVLLCLEFER
jgi:hypothetical protein